MTKSGVTKEGTAFLTAALDPMHDGSIEHLCGWPDQESGPSVVRCIKQSLEIRTPYAAGSGNWSCAIIMWPWISHIAGARYSREGTNMLMQPDYLTVPGYGGLTVQASKSSNFNFIPNSAITSGVLTPIGFLSVPQTYLNGSGRVIAMGFEVIDTTAELYKQGMATSFRVTEQVRQKYNTRVANTGTSNTASGFTDMYVVRPPPDTLAQAMLLPGTTQWEAREGVYSVATFQGSENPAEHPMYTSIVMSNKDLTAGIQPVAVEPNVWGTYIDSTSVTFSMQRNAIKIENVNLSGAFFTGLNENSTLTVRWHVYYESFPSPSEPDILVLARPPAPYDPIALEYLKRVSITRPVACQSGMNPNGEWFWEILNDLADIAPAVAGFVGGPPAAALASAVSAGAKPLINKKLSKEQKKAKLVGPQPRQAAPNTSARNANPVKKRKKGTNTNKPARS